MPWSYASLIQTLKAASIDEAADEAALLLHRFCGVSRAALLCDRTRLYESADLDTAVEKRLQRYPLQYIIGEWDFFGRPFAVGEACLIPRPDTEILVETALKHIPKDATVADLCTGSGCIAVSILCERSDVTCCALELYPNTMAVAVHNAERLGVHDRFVPVEADLLSNGVDALKKALQTVHGGQTAQFDVMLSNPPYIPSKTVDALEPELTYEPRAALDGGDDGLIFYRRILSAYRPLIRDGGYLMMEIGYDQADSLRLLAETYSGWSELTVVKDLCGMDRVVCLKAEAIPKN